MCICINLYIVNQYVKIELVSELSYICFCVVCLCDFFFFFFLNCYGAGCVKIGIYMLSVCER